MPFILIQRAKRRQGFCDVVILLRCVGMRCVAHMDDQIRFQHFLKRRAKRGYELRRQIGDEADRIGQDYFSAGRQFHSPHCRIERGEEHIFRQNFRTC